MKHLISISVIALMTIQMANAWWFVQQSQSSLSCGACSCWCSSGSKYQHRTPTKNGCGGSGFPAVNPYGFGTCCNAHDTCYGTAGKTKNGCDDDMYQCMDNICTSLGSTTCHGMKHSFNSVLKVGGCYFFRSAQKNNVKCR